MRAAGKPNSHATINYVRGGTKNWIRKQTDDYINRLSRIVENERDKIGKISDEFCKQFGYLTVDYYGIIAIDIIRDSHRNIKKMVEVFRPLVRDRDLIFFGAELYQLFDDWINKKQLNREAMATKNWKVIRDLFYKYQNIRPDTSIINHLGTTNDYYGNNISKGDQNE